MIGTQVQLDAVTVSYGGSQALHDVSLTLGRGVTAVLGPNGAGKTTLMRVVATVLTPDAGSVRLLGADPADPQARVGVRRQLGYLPQEVGYYRSFTTFDFVDYVAVLKEIVDEGNRHAEVRRVLRLVDLDAHGDKRLRALSTGMRRRVGLAQALLGRPELVVLDEPTDGLDADQRARFRRIVADLAVSATVLVSTHVVDDVAGIATHVVVLEGGRVAFSGPTAALAARAPGAPDSGAALEAAYLGLIHHQEASR